MDYSIDQQHIYALSERLGRQLLAKQWQVATAESCSGGGVAAAITQVPGSSAWFEFGIVSYANRAKIQMLNVQERTLQTHGAVSEAVVIEMVKGALAVASADVAVAISGVAGPAGGTLEKPVGTVWFAWASVSGELHTNVHIFSGSRAQIQRQAVESGLMGLLSITQ